MSLDFVLPLQRMDGLAARKDQLTALEKTIDAEVSRLYGLTEEDLAAIDRELSGPAAAEDVEDGESEGSSGDDDTEADGDFTPADWARAWISYALGTAGIRRLRGGVVQ